MTFRHCTAWPAWPFRRLSMALITTTWLVRLSTATDSNARLVWRTHLVEG